MKLPEFLSRLDKVREVRTSRKHAQSFLACCPAHDDTNPSLSVDLSHDGRVLVHCHSHHCAFHDIVSAVGMTESDLMPERDRNYKPLPYERQAHVDYDNDFVDIARGMIERGEKLTDSDRKKYLRLRLGVSG